MEDSSIHITTPPRTTAYQSHTVGILVTTATILVGVLSIYLTFFDGTKFF